MLPEALPIVASMSISGLKFSYYEESGLLVIAQLHLMQGAKQKQLERPFVWMHMAKSKSSSKYDMVIKAKGTTSRILEVSETSVRIESNEKGTVAGKYYSGYHWDTVEATMQPDGTASLAVKYMHVTSKGDSIVGTGTGTQDPANSRGIAKVRAEGRMWTSSQRLQNLNGARWVVEGEFNTIKETIIVRCNFELNQ